MVGYDPKKKNLNIIDLLQVSSATSILTRMLIQPFDVVKIRYQVQYEPIDKFSYISKYRSITQTFSTIVREEGIFALWKGHLTGQILSLTFNASQFVSFQVLTKYLNKISPNMNVSENKKVLNHFLCGGLAGSFTVFVNQPIDTIRTRLVTQGEPKIYNGVIDSIKKIYSNEGYRGFFRGLLPAIMLVAPETAFRFAIYQFLNSNLPKIIESIKKMPKNTQTNKEISMLQSSINGTLTGILSKTIVYPFDLAKKRLQIQGFEDARMHFGKIVKFNGLFNCFYLTIQNEGILGLYKGFLPSMLKAAVSTGLTFFFFENFTKIAINMKSK